MVRERIEKGYKQDDVETDMYIMFIIPHHYHMQPSQRHRQLEKARGGHASPKAVSLASRLREVKAALVPALAILAWG